MQHQQRRPGVPGNLVPVLQPVRRVPPAAEERVLARVARGYLEARRADPEAALEAALREAEAAGWSRGSAGLLLDLLDREDEGQRRALAGEVVEVLAAAGLVAQAA